ncbi:MAG: PilZ domain-containing protein [Thermodesulfobacteriota bacterium]
MLDITCRRCGSRFYTASPYFIKKCPYCNFDLRTKTPVRRKEERAEIKTGCLLVKGSLNLSATATDISPKGVGIVINDAAPLHIDDSIHVIIEELDIDSDAKVVWIRQADGSRTETGLIFNPQ